jgi:3',5'-cyclic AMP phosphodiesterase CpdA
MLDLAHVTDLHLVESDHERRRGVEWQRLHYVSAGRRIDAPARRQRALEALRAAGRHATHVVVTGDLTEDGVPAQFEVLAEVLDETRIDPRRITLVPGNHDRYAEGEAFEQALAGPLQAYASTSAAGCPLELGRDALLMAVSTATPQSCLRSAGRLSPEDARRIDWLANDARRSGRLALVAQHHPPQGHANPTWNWIDGLLEAEAGRALLDAHAHLQFLHGHTHKHDSTSFRAGRPPQAHSGAAVVTTASSVRYYQITREALLPAELAASPARSIVRPQVALA